MTLENKLGIIDTLELAKAEERIAKLKALELYENKLLNQYPAGSFSALQAIHYYLFEEIYGFAGQLRSVNVIKGNVTFVPVNRLQTVLAYIDKLPQSTFDEIAEKYIAMYIAHPFRDGNGRVTRIWLDHMLRRELGRTIAWSLVDREAYLKAMDQSGEQDKAVKALLKNALTKDIRDRELLMNGIDHSFAYEGYRFFHCRELQ